MEEGGFRPAASRSFGNSAAALAEVAPDRILGDTGLQAGNPRKARVGVLRQGPAGGPEAGERPARGEMPQYPRVVLRRGRFLEDARDRGMRALRPVDRLRCLRRREQLERELRAVGDANALWRSPDPKGGQP